MSCWEDNSLLEVQLLQASQLLLREGEPCGVREGAKHFLVVSKPGQGPCAGTFCSRFWPQLPI